MYITAFFTDGFAPKTGLSPLPKVSVVRLSDNTIVVNAQNMTESLLAGYYYYDFTTYDPTEEYAMTSDGGSQLDNVERYKFGSVDEVGAILSKINDILDDTNELQQDWENDGRLDNILDEIAGDVENIDGDVMRGTDGVDTSPMRGTDGANTVTPDPAGTGAIIVGEVDANEVKIDSIISSLTGLATNTDMTFLKKIINNKKTLEKEVDTWYLIIYDDDNSTPIMKKALKDKDDNDISDILAGTLAKEFKTIV